MNMNLQANCKAMAAAPQTNARWIESLLPLDPVAAEIVPQYFGKVSYQYADVGHYQFNLQTLNPPPQSVNALGCTLDGSLIAGVGRTGSLLVWRHFDIREHTPDHLRYVRRSGTRRGPSRPLPQLLLRPESHRDVTAIAGMAPLRQRRITCTDTRMRDSFLSQGLFVTGDECGNILLWDANQAAGVPSHYANPSRVRSTTDEQIDGQDEDISSTPSIDDNGDNTNADNLSMRGASDALVSWVSRPAEAQGTDQITALATTSQSQSALVAAGYMDGTAVLFDAQTSSAIRGFNEHYLTGRSVRSLLFICDQYDYQLVEGERVAPRYRQVGCFCACHDRASEGNTLECIYCSCGTLGLMHDDDEEFLRRQAEAGETFGGFPPQLAGAVRRPPTASGQAMPKMFRQPEGGELLVTAGWDASVHVYDLRVERPAVTISQHVAAVNALAHWKPMACGGPGLLATAGWDRQILTWDLRNTSSPMHVLEGHKRHVSSLGVLPSGELVSCSRDRHLRIWDLETCPVEKAYLLSTCGTETPDCEAIAKGRASLAQLPVARYVVIDGSVNKKAAVNHYAHPAHPWALRDEYCATAEDSCTGEFEIPEPISSMTILPSGTIVTGGRECLQKVAFNGYKGSLMCWDSVPEVDDAVFGSMMNPMKPDTKARIITMGSIADRKDLKKKRCKLMPMAGIQMMSKAIQAGFSALRELDAMKSEKDQKSVEKTKNINNVEKTGHMEKNNDTLMRDDDNNDNNNDNDEATLQLLRDLFTKAVSSVQHHLYSRLPDVTKPWYRHVPDAYNDPYAGEIGLEQLESLIQASEGLIRLRDKLCPEGKIVTNTKREESSMSTTTMDSK